MEIDNWVPWYEALESTGDRYVLLRIDMRDCHAYAGEKLVHSEESEQAIGQIPVEEIKKIVKLVKEDKWAWLSNSRCKYISIHVDKETQLFDLYDRDDVKITLEQLQRQ